MSQSSNMISGIAIVLYAGSIASSILATRRIGNKPVEGNIKEYAREYTPAALLFVCATSLVVTVNIRDARRFESVFGAYQLTKDALEDLQTSLPAKVLKDANERILQEDVDTRFEVPEHRGLLVAPEVYCLDHTTGQSFIMSVEHVHKAVQALNYQVIKHSWASMNDYCDEFGLEHISGGENLGWTEGPIVVKLSPKLKDDILPVVVISISPLPSPLYK